MDYLTQILERNRQAAPRQTPWPAEPQEVLWFFPEPGTASVRRTPAAAVTVPDETLAAALEEVERTAERLTRHWAESTVLPAAPSASGSPAGRALAFDLGTETGTFGSLSAALVDRPDPSAPTMEEISRYFERDARRYG